MEPQEIEDMFSEFDNISTKDGNTQNWQKMKEKASNMDINNDDNYMTSLLCSSSPSNDFLSTMSLSSFDLNNSPSNAAIFSFLPEINDNHYNNFMNMPSPFLLSPSVSALCDNYAYQPLPESVPNFMNHSFEEYEALDIYPPFLNSMAPVINLDYNPMDYNMVEVDNQSNIMPINANICHNHFCNHYGNHYNNHYDININIFSLNPDAMNIPSVKCEANKDLQSNIYSIPKLTNFTIPKTETKSKSNPKSKKKKTKLHKKKRKQIKEEKNKKKHKKKLKINTKQQIKRKSISKMKKQRSKQYECDYCEKSFKTQYEIRRHLRVHTGDRPFGCPECGKKFKQKQHMVTHKRSVHNNIRPHFCVICDKRFKEKGTLTKHIQNIHIIKYKMLQCPAKQCKKRFKRKGNLKSHIQRMHAAESQSLIKTI